MSLDNMRNRIDEIDEQLVHLYEERMKISEEVGEYKIQSGKKVFDKNRERAKLATVEGMVSNEFNRIGIGELFEHIMATSRKLQYRLLTKHGALGRLPFILVDSLESDGTRVVFQGLKGAYSQHALKQFFGDNVFDSQVETFRDAMETIEEGSADFAVLPIENSSAGAVSQVYDLLVEFENYIVGEIAIPIEHALVGLKGTKIDEIRRVYSHPQALMQSEKFLDGYRDIEQISVGNTAIAAQKIITDNDKTKAAICSEYAASVYGLEVLQKQINHNENNTTRFIVVTNQKIFLKEAKKISICFEVTHKSGSLYHLLSHFIYNNLNMTKIESRPVEGRTWEYRFFVDFEGNMASPSVKNAIRGLREEAMNLKILGNY